MLRSDSTPRPSRFSPQTPSRLALLAGAMAVILILGPSRLEAQLTDDFTDGDDTANPTWTHLTGTASSSGQSWTVAGGSYRLQAPNNGFSGYGFVGSHIGPSIPDVTVQTDFVNFGGPGANPVFGVGARLNGNNAFVGLTGYAYVYEPYAASLAGELVLYRIDAGGLGVDIGSQPVSLDPLKDYTFVLNINGSTLHGQVFEIGGGLVGERFATDSAYTTGLAGVLGFGRSGVTAPTDFTIDNFSVVPEPGVSVLLGLGLLGIIAARRVWPARA